MWQYPWVCIIGKGLGKDKLFALCRTQCLEVYGRGENDDKITDGVFHVDECGGKIKQRRGIGEKLQFLLWWTGKLHTY